MENMVPGVHEKMELDYESVRRRSPISFISAAVLWEERDPSRLCRLGIPPWPAGRVFSPDRLAGPIALWGLHRHTDSVAPSFSLIALIGALLYRRRTGKGVYIDQSQTEAGAYFLGPAILDYQVNGRTAQRQGNRDRHGPPRDFPLRWRRSMGGYRALQFGGMGKVLSSAEREAWLEDERFATVTARKRNENEWKDSFPNGRRNSLPKP